MKQVIVVCFMAISLCLSVPQGNPSTGDGAAAGNMTAASPSPLPAGQLTTTTLAPQNEKAPVTNSTINSTTNITEAPAPKTNTTEHPPSLTPSTTTSSSVPSNTTTTSTTSAKPPTPSTQTGPEAGVTPKTSEPAPVQTARGFDGGSFVGGIILTLGLLAIGFMGFKYYKNQTERNYHTL